MRVVRHGPGSALLSVDKRRRFSAHSVTVRFSGGFMLAMTLATTAFNRCTFPLFILAVTRTYIRVPVHPLPDPFLVFLRVILILRQLLHEQGNLFPGSARSDPRML